MTSILERALLAYARRFPLQKGKLRLVDALWRMGVRDGDSGRVADLKYGGMKMPCDLSESLQRQFYFFGTYVLEEKMLAWWSDAAAAAEIVFDVGANVGIYSVAALAARPRTTVHAFEPTPELAEKLRATARFNRLDNLIVHEMAVSSSSGQAILRRFRGAKDENEGMNYIITDRGEPNVERVRTVSLDDFCARHDIPRIDLLKLDVQGQENAVLRGAERLIRSGRLKMLIMELNWSGGAACPATEAIRLLDRAGYRFIDPNAPGAPREAGPWLHSLNDVVAQHVG